VASPFRWNPLATSATLPTVSIAGRWQVYISDYQTQHGGSWMLVLSRKVNEVLMIGDVAVTVVKISKDTVRIGVTAPPSVSVDRLEVRQAKESNNGAKTSERV
jgi:carbon storage regulator